MFGYVSVANVLTSVMWKKILNVSCTATKHNAESFEENKQELRQKVYVAQVMIVLQPKLS